MMPSIYLRTIQIELLMFEIHVFFVHQHVDFLSLIIRTIYRAVAAALMIEESEK